MQPLLVVAATCVFTAGLSVAQTPANCAQTIASDTKAITKDLSAIVAQADAQGFNSAVEQFASDVETILPTLNPASQTAVQKFVSDLIEATSATSPGGTTVTASERLKLTTDWTVLVDSTGITSEQIATISNDLISALNILKSVSTAQLQADISILRGDLGTCHAELISGNHRRQ